MRHYATCSAFCLAFALVSGAHAVTVPTARVTASQGEGQRVLTPEDVARTRSVGEAEINPQGTLIAYTVSVPRAPGVDEDGPAWSELHVVGSDGGDPRPFVAGKVSVSHIRWSPDGTHIAYLAKRDADASTAIYVIPVQGGESRRLVSHETDIRAFEWRRDGRAIAFVAADPVPADLAELRKKGFNQQIYEEDWQPRAISIVDLPAGASGDAGTRRVLRDLPGQPWHAVWSPDGTRLLVDLSPRPLVDDELMFRRLHVLDAASGRVLAKIDNPGKLGRFAWSPNGKTIVLISAADLNDPMEGRLMVVGAGGGPLRDLLPGLEGHVEDFDVTRKGEIVYMASVGVGSRIGRVRVDGSGGAVLYEGTDPVVDALSADPGGRQVALVAESPTTPEEVFALRLDGRRAPTRLTNQNPWLAEIRLGRREIVRWTAKDGLMIEGLLIHPAERPAGARVPTIVVAHGGPEAHYKNGWLTTYSVPGQVAAGRGYAVFYPNYRGSTGRGVAFAKADHRDPGGAEFDDVLAGVDFLIARGVTDSERVGITGGSYGGYFTAWGATKHSHRFAAGVMFVGISDNVSKFGTSDIPRELELVHWLTTPYDDLDLALDRSPLLHVKNARTPLLILHGKEDTRVNPGQSLELYRWLRWKGDVPVRLVYYPGEGHGNRRAASRYDYNLRMLRWFDHFLKERRRDLPPWRLEYGKTPEVSGVAPGQAPGACDLRFKAGPEFICFPEDSAGG